MIRRLVSINDHGHRVGEHHPKAKLSDDQVEEMRRMFDTGLYGYKALAKQFGVSRDTVRSIVTYRRRNSWAARAKWVDK